ncbi:MAG: TolC family protein [Bacteroidota bacterium]
MKHLLFLLLIVMSIPAKSQLQFHSFQELLEYADEHAIAILSAELNEQIAESEKKEAGSFLIPSINASLGYNDNISLQPTLVPAQFFNPEAPEDEFQELNFGTKYNYTRGFSAQWDILNFQKNFAFQTAKIGIEESKANTEINRYNTYNQLASTYYSILLSQESIRLYEENVELSTSIFELAEEKFEQGLISEADLNRSAIKKLQDQRNLDMARNNVQQFTLQLMGQLNTKEEVKILDTPASFMLTQTSIMYAHPEIVMQEATVKKYESMLKQTKAARLPSLSFIYQNNKTWATNNFMDFSNANQLPQQVFGVSLNFSGLFSPSNRFKVKQSKSQLQLKQMQLENTRLIKDQEDDLLQLQLKQNSDQLANSKQILQLQEKNDFHAEQTYQSGIISLDQRLNKYDELLLSQDQYLQSLASYSLAQYKIYIRQIDFSPKK